jgi:hypothetical protein
MGPRSRVLAGQGEQVLPHGGDLPGHVRRLGAVLPTTVSFPRDPNIE